MKKLIALTTLFVSITSFSYSQSIQLQNAINALRNKDYEKAKTAIDAASVHESTKGNAKMWMLRGKVYQAIYSDTSAKVRGLDLEAEEKALDSYLNCFINDKDKLYSDAKFEDNARGGIVSSAGATNSKANFYKSNKEYVKAIYCYDLLEKALPYNFDQGLTRNNITKEKLMFNKFETYKYAANKEKTMEYADQLIGINYKDPKIYTDMVKLSLIDKDTTKALKYLDKGKIMFEDNMELITYELDIYLARKKTDELIDKLTKAIEVSPDNELLHFILGISYEKTKKIELAEKEYLKTLELKSDYEPANYNIGVLYYSAGKEWNDKANNLPPKDTKLKEYETKSNDYFKKAVTYFEASYDATKDKRTKQILRQLCARLGDTAKAEKYK